MNQHRWSDSKGFIKCFGALPVSWDTVPSGGKDTERTDGPLRRRRLLSSTPGLLCGHPVVLRLLQARLQRPYLNETTLLVAKFSLCNTCHAVCSPPLHPASAGTLSALLGPFPVSFLSSSYSVPNEQVTESSVTFITPFRANKYLFQGQHALLFDAQRIFSHCWGHRFFLPLGWPAGSFDVHSTVECHHEPGLCSQVTLRRITALTFLKLLNARQPCQHYLMSWCLLTIVSYRH